jgi:hypothetical protein
MTNYDELIGTLRRKGADKKVWMGEETFELRCQDQTAIDAADAIVQLQARVAELEAEISARSDLMQGYLDCWRNDKARAERAEADLAAARALLREARQQIPMTHARHEILRDRIDKALAGEDAA